MRAFKRKDGKGNWWAEWAIGKVDGKYRYPRKSGFRTEREALVYAADQEQEHRRPDEYTMTVAVFVGRWL